MKTYLAYKNQIEGFEDVSETVKTVEKIAASSIHFLKNEVSALNTYKTLLEKVLVRLLLFYREEDHQLLEKKNFGKRAIIAVTGDKGLVGGLWHKIINAFLDRKEEYPALIVIGKRGENYFKEEDIKILKSFKREEEVENIKNYIFTGFKEGSFSQVDILYSKFISLAEQKADFSLFLPFDFKLTGKGAPGKGWPIAEPSTGEIFNQLLQKYIGIFFEGIMLETKLSEFSARTVAMEQAAAKTDELIQKLNLDYLKERRRVITQRQLESFSIHRIL